MKPEVEIRFKATATVLALRPSDILLIQFDKPDIDMDIFESTYTGFQGALRRAGLSNEVVVITSGISVKPITERKVKTRGSSSTRNGRSNGSTGNRRQRALSAG